MTSVSGMLQYRVIIILVGSIVVVLGLISLGIGIISEIIKRRRIKNVKN